MADLKFVAAALKARTDLNGATDANAAAALNAPVPVPRTDKITIAVIAGVLGAARAEWVRRDALWNAERSIDAIHQQFVDANIAPAVTDPSKPTPTVADYKSFVARK
jgi:hypothetical protein